MSEPDKSEFIAADPHFGSDEVMLAWCKDCCITPQKYKDGTYDWNAAWDEYIQRPENGDEEETI